MTKEDINRLHSTRSAIENKKYSDEEGNIYIGLENGRLKILDKAVNTTFKSTSLLEATDVQKAIEEILTQQVIVKEVEIDFGSELYQTEKKFEVIDFDIDINDIVLAEISYKKPSGKDLDELEVDVLTIKAAPFNGGAYFYIMSSTGSLHGKFIVSYQIKKK